jgi:hypothetical protein
MAKTKLVFLGTERSETNEVELQAYCNAYNEIFISLIPYGGAIDSGETICLDRETAIKLVKNLKFEISKMEVDNG